MSKEEILELLDELGARLEEPASRVWEMAIRYNLTVSIVGIVAAVAMIGLGIWLRRWAVRRSWPYPDAPEKGMSIAGAVVLWVIGAAVLSNNLINLINIDYVTLRGLLP